MSTRAHVRIVNGEETRMFYRHCDGRPGDLGKAIQRYLNRLKVWDTDKIIAKLTGGLKYWDRKDLVHRIAETDYLHGDEDYVYVVDVASKTMKCYAHYLDEPYERCCIPLREMQVS